MKVAILSSIAWRTPPRNYGPWEQVASTLTEGLHKRGIEVTLFATADSITKAALESSCSSPYAENDAIDPKVAECLHISHLMEQASEYDLIHNHFDFLPLTYSKLIKTPMLTTIHGFSSPKILEVYQKYNSTNQYVSISNANRSPELQYIATVYNGIARSDFPFVASPANYLLFFGRIHPDKGTFEAIKIAQKAQRPLIIAGIVQDESYFKEMVAPFIDNEQVIYYGNADPDGRKKLLGNAYALLHPIAFDEPFGLSVAEAMMCGTPVIAFNRGSMPELIAHQKTGFLVQNIEEATQAVANLPQLKRDECRQWSLSRFSEEKMVNHYLSVYEKVLSK